jgi:hypothetical protein
MIGRSMRASRCAAMCLSVSGFSGTYYGTNLIMEQ